MAIDTQAKRCSAIASRRLPWFRRFAPIPDGSMTQGDRQQLSFVYRGVLAGGAETPSYETVYTTGYTWVDVATSGYTWQEVRIER